MVFFVALVIMGNFILLNLFLAILLKNFESKGEVDMDSDLEEVSIIKKLSAKLSSFKFFKKNLGNALKL